MATRVVGDPDSVKACVVVFFVALVLASVLEPGERRPLSAAPGPQVCVLSVLNPYIIASHTHMIHALLLIWFCVVLCFRVLVVAFLFSLGPVLSPNATNELMTPN